MFTLLTMILLFVFLYVGNRISSYLHFDAYYISIPYLASILMICLSLIISIWNETPMIIPAQMESLFVSLFLLSIGVHIGLHLNQIYILRMLKLTLLSSLIIFSLNTLSYVMHDDLKWLIGSVMFAFNVELIDRVVPLEQQQSVYFWGALQMVIIFVLTPLFLFIMEKLYDKIFPQREKVLQTQQTVQNSKLLATFIIFSVSIFSVSLIIFIKSYIKVSYIPFLFDFVPVLILGIVCGKWFLPFFLSQREFILQKMSQLGTWALYAFIVSTILHVQTVDWSYFAWDILGLLLLKTIIIALFTILIVYKLKYVTKSSFMVASAAGWTFTLSAPVVCMHAMRTAVNKQGPAPEVLLVVPPLILWLVNYVHLWLIFIF